MLCVLCGARGDFPLGFCNNCESLIYRNNDRAEFQRVLRDVLQIKNLPASIRQRIEKLLEHSAPFDAAKVGIYTRAEYFNSRAPAQHVFREYPLWIAHYKTNAPTLPRGWSDWVLWQFTAEGDGVAHGVGSKEIDCNYYKGEVVGNSPTRPQLVASFDGVEVVYETA